MITHPPKVTMAALGGFGRDLTSTRCSFFNLDTSIRVYSRIRLASATDSSASLLSSWAFFVSTCASASSTETIF